MKNKKGFSLIELLIVVAIIGVLSSVVLASVNDARTKAMDAVVKGSLKSIQSQAQMYYEDHSSIYAGLCSDPAVLAIFNKAIANAGVGVGYPVWGGPHPGICNDTFQFGYKGYVVYVSLKSLPQSYPSSYWCVDSTGYVGIMTNTSGGGPESLSGPELPNNCKQPNL
ncbi:MAG: Pilin domain-containing protein [Parcubacteria group bacterium GW2011_GWC1_35_8]|uniref:Type II secretion system protein GspG C-terminal domain-containing protein n=2 Tax=Candidatus Nomuraibacteriota TaxID=1752729 RepID=A0A1F6YV54_9BACT|nr:MAG: Pilin domain-containing protein [Parcubacteria group bacterium GW2011_GWC1_35_8]KKP88550.1 MAG: Pilin domain-containing protein [Candidatus Nomurabacteria bacterium GW2011_GWC2_35_8]OGJ10246.1 MAG: hypothetical protein A2456_03230 [Candidatus Nomurabacteria bacterium RIFOXYC2_FULL_36_19]OGJ14293.1 MAG: hypothetical protein A2554_00785 [Candidatus Nomurabacteria bacterium RIFOXYD2_FULL_35_12]